jgi:hypothetical protein
MRDVAKMMAVAAVAMSLAGCGENQLGKPKQPRFRHAPIVRSDVVRSVEGSEVALFLKAVPGGRVRGNLRSKGDLDVSSVARLMGGGGHRAAAGFIREGGIDEVLSAVLPPLRRLVNGQDEGCEAR